MTADLWDQRRVLGGLGAAGASLWMAPSADALGLPRRHVEIDVNLLTKIGEYSTYRAGMLLNSRPDGSFMNW
jgi:hypothetical protein